MTSLNLDQKTSKIRKDLTPYREEIGELFCDIETTIDNLKEDTSRASREGRKLRIGVVGQVKSGKSSFLNSLIFNGTGVLPKAATPMTAALTVIEYSSEIKATVEFYTQGDWQNIEKAAAKHDKKEKEIRARLFQNTSKSLFGKAKKSAPTEEHIKAIIEREIPDDLKASKELVDMARKSGLKVSEHLGKEETLSDIHSIEDLMNRLQNYVGAGGKFTPIVRNTVISSSTPEMEGIEIVDTPGINDPVISRGRLTKKRLGECDVVFVLSQCSQFVDSTDMELLIQNLPSRGIRKIILVGSQLDSTLIGEKHKYPSLPKLMAGVVSSLEERVSSSLKNLLSKAKAKEEIDILKALIETPPVFVSSMAFNMSVHFNDMDEEEAHNLRLYNGLYPEKYSFDEDLLRDFSNIKKAKTILEEVQSEKENILSERLKNIESGASDALDRNVRKIKDKIERQKSKLESGDVATLEEKAKDIVERLEKGKTHIEAAFDNVIGQTKRDLEREKLEIKKISSSFKKIDTQEESHTESYDVEVSTSRWWNPFSWFSSRTETRYKTISTRYANTHDAIDQVERFSYETESRLKNAIMDLIDLPRLRSDVKAGTMKLFDMEDMSFDPDDVLIPVDRLVNSITLPSIDFGNRDYGKTISSRFNSNKVEDSDISSLENAQREAISTILDDMERSLNSKITEISQMLEKSKSSFFDKLVKDIEEDLNRTRKELQQREESLEKYGKIVELLKKYI